MKATLSAAFAVLALSIFAPNLPLHAQDSSATSSADDLKTLQGAWQGVELGKEGEGQCSLAIEGNVVRFRGANKKEWYVGELTLPAGKNPKQLQVRVTECSHPEMTGKVAPAIYKVEGASLTLVGREPGNPEPPKSFDDTSSARTLMLKKSDSAKPAKGNAKVAPGDSRTVEQRFEDADLDLALAHYEKLQSAAFEIRLKLEVDPPPDQQIESMRKKEAMLRARAEELRDEAIRRAKKSGR